MSIDPNLLSLNMLATVSSFSEPLLPAVTSSSSSRRTILPLHKTPSLLVNKSGAFDSDTSAAKTAERIATFCVDRVVQAVLGCQQTRGKTVLQGAQAPSGYQAAHASLQPTLEDDFTTQVIDKILINGVTPTKTEPWLRSRLGLSSAEIQDLHKNHSDPGHVLGVFFKNLSVTAQRSTISGTYYEKRRNATYSNPTESNQLDTALERYLAPYMPHILQNTDGKSPADFARNATKQLTELMNTFYTDSTNNLRTRIEDIETFCFLQSALYEYEQSFAKDAKTIPLYIEEYIKVAQELLNLKRKLTKSEVGAPAYSQIQTAGIDYKKLTSFVRAATDANDIRDLPLNSPPKTEVNEHLTHYRLLLAEAETQLQEIEVYNQDSSIESLFISTFGIADTVYSRRAPTDKELQAQVFELMKQTSPQKQPRTSNSRPAFTGARKLFKDE